MAGADDIRRLAEEAATAYTDRVGTINAIKEETKRMLQDFDKAHMDMSAELRDHLVKTEAERKDLTQAEIRERAAQVSQMLKDFDEAHADMTAELKATLAEVKPFLSKEVSQLLKGFRQEHEETAAAWRELVATMQATRGRKAAVPKAKAAVRKVAEGLEEEEEVEEEEEMEEGLEDDILEVLEENPNGITLTEMGYAMGVPFQKLAGPTKALIGKRKIRKKDKLYSLKK